MHQIVHILGDVGAVVADALDVLGGERRCRAQADVARILHHVGEKLAKKGIVHGIDALVVAPHRVGLVGIALGIGIEHVLELAERQFDHMPEAGHQRLGVALARHGQGALGDILAQVADALQVACDLQHRHDVAQVVGHGLALRDHEDRQLLDVALEHVDGRGRWRQRPRRAWGRASPARRSPAPAGAPPGRPSGRSSCRAAPAPGRTT